MKYFLILFVVFFVTSCRVDIPLHEMDVPHPTFSNLYDARVWISQNISYKYDENDYWQTPGETITLGTGDCEDFALLLGYYANELGYNPEMGYETSHANLIIDRMVYSPEVIDEYNKSDFTFVLIEYYGKALYRCPAYR